MAKLMTLNPYNDFRATMSTAKTFGDLDKAIEQHLNKQDCIELYKALKLVNDALELTYHDQTVLRALKSNLQYGFGVDIDTI